MAEQKVFIMWEKWAANLVDISNKLGLNEGWRVVSVSMGGSLGNYVSLVVVVEKT